MSEEHKMTAKDKLVLTATLAIIFFGILGLGLIGIIFNLLGQIELRLGVHALDIHAIGF